MHLPIYGHTHKTSFHFNANKPKTLPSNPLTIINIAKLKTISVGTLFNIDIYKHYLFQKKDPFYRQTQIIFTHPITRATLT